MVDGSSGGRPGSTNRFSLRGRHGRRRSGSGSQGADGWADRSLHLDGIVVKKISQTYSPATLDRLEMLRLAEASGTKVFSSTRSILGLVNRLSCTVTLANAGIPMPATCVSESEDEALAAVLRFGSAVFKPLFSTKARGMTLMDATEGETALRHKIAAFKADNPVMYLQKKVNLPAGTSAWFSSAVLSRHLCPRCPDKQLEHDHPSRWQIRTVRTGCRSDRTGAPRAGTV